MFQLFMVKVKEKVKSLILIPHLMCVH